MHNEDCYSFHAYGLLSTNEIRKLSKKLNLWIQDNNDWLTIIVLYWKLFVIEYIIYGIYILQYKNNIEKYL